MGSFSIKGLRFFIAGLVFVCFLLPSCLSWDWSTHFYAAREICDYLGCGNCLPDMLNGSIAPDRDFKDFANHHCYSPLWNCPKGDWLCPDAFDCPALEKADYWLAKSREDSGCQKYYDIGVASHYFLDSKVFWHQVESEEYDKCHAKFEELVGENIDKNFNISVCGVNITKVEFEGYVRAFEGRLGGVHSKEAVIGGLILLLILATAFKFRK